MKKFEKVSKTGDVKEESEVAKAVQKLADDVSPFHEIFAPESYKNMTGMYLLRLKRLRKDLLIISHPRTNEVGNYRLITKNPVYQLGWPILVDCRQLDISDEFDLEYP